MRSARTTRCRGDLPDDLKRFKALTLGKPILMGRKTAQSLGRALPGRLNLVLTRSGRVPFDGMQAVASLDDACRIVDEAGADELCVIGGGEVYALALPQATHLHLTWVDTAVSGADAFFPRVRCRPLARNVSRVTCGRCAACAGVRVRGLRKAVGAGVTGCEKGPE